MNQGFRNSSQVECVFTDDGITFGGKEQEIFFPYSRIDTINLSLLGIFQVGYRSTICTFAVDRADRAAVKAAIKEAKELMKTAPDDEIRTIDLHAAAAEDPAVAGMSKEDQLKHWKSQFIQGVISKQEYDAYKRQLKD